MPRFIVIKIVRFINVINDSLTVSPASAASPIAPTNPTGPERSLNPYFPVTRSTREIHIILAVETVSLPENANTFRGFLFNPLI